MTSLKISLLIAILIVSLPLIEGAEVVLREKESYIKVNNQLLARVSDNEVKFYQLDFMRNVRTEFNLNGVDKIIDYLPFGEIPKTLVKLTRTLGYRSSVFDKNTNFYITYDPELGRFLVPVTKIANKFDSQTLNPYSFMQNNPFREVTSESIYPDLTIPERQDGVEGKSVSGAGTLSKKFESRAYVNKVPYRQVRAIAQAFCSLFCSRPEPKKLEQEKIIDEPSPFKPETPIEPEEIDLPKDVNIKRTTKLGEMEVIRPIQGIKKTEFPTITFFAQTATTGVGIKETINIMSSGGGPFILGGVSTQSPGGFQISPSIDFLDTYSGYTPYNPYGLSTTQTESTGFGGK